ncbi:Crp/Fnr family transcriptional regulator [Paenibacillus glycanilyticus]|uniref:Crp/Fnr family transcriptional regulator n=1 Tax=Paenibacillus glycanilyticus TaxID=126569 RepID=UPI00203ECB68|nr:Crp/Fnr family transcriptional regulator [Paenibacillus glycanilyticus]MCM3629096.1 Crp/Fnr family transcriptional regulator [Paenibacillus glycanilyticus]
MKQDNNRMSLLSQIKIFESLPGEIIQEIDQSINESNQNMLPKNSIFQTPGNEKDGLFFVIAGKLRIYKTNPAGKQFTVCILSEGGMFGEVESFSLATRGTYVEAMEKTLLVWMQTEQVNLLLSKYSELALRFLSEMSTRLREQDELLEKLIFRDLRGKVLYFLNRLSKKFSVEVNGYRKIEIPLTHQELANMIGATREAVSLVLQDLSSEGVIVTSRRMIMIHYDKVMEELS